MISIDNIENETDPIEIEANYFAVCLLMPTNMLLKDMVKYKLKKDDYGPISRLYGVPYNVARYRLKILFSDD